MILHVIHLLVTQLFYIVQILDSLHKEENQEISIIFAMKESSWLIEEGLNYLQEMGI